MAELNPRFGHYLQKKAEAVEGLRQLLAGETRVHVPSQDIGIDVLITDALQAADEFMLESTERDRQLLELIKDTLLSIQPYLSPGQKGDRVYERAAGMVDAFEIVLNARWNPGNLVPPPVATPPETPVDAGAETIALIRQAKDEEMP